ncbi:BatD family protein [Xanthobacter sp. V4C-4]|uniref:BatD family protein n=1 Tax=Xanthobacter cornucopiae TaxID=3119924 RepID=UPI003726E8DB
MKTTSRRSGSRPVLPALLLAAVLGGALAGAGLAPAQAASLSAAPDRFVVTAGETFDLVLSLTDGDSRDPPDVSPLARDFDIVDRRRASRAEMIGGKPAHVDQWVMTLLPKRVGTLAVPPLSVGGLTSAPVQVQVVPASGQAGLDDEPLFVRVEAAATPAFVQSDVPVTIRIYDSIGMRSGSMEQPVADGATFTPDGGQRSYVKTIGRRRYRVIEQSYLMRPQRSGVITIPPITLTASLPGFKGSSAGSDMSNMLGRGMFGDLASRTETLRSRPVSVTVQPRPAGVSGWFLPARGVTLTQEWSAPPADAKVGDTLTRTLTLAARGAGPNQLPPLEAAPVEGLRQYAEDSRSDATLIDGEGGAALVKSFAVVPTRPGPVTLPAIEVPWWNLSTNRQEMAVLPAVTLNVRPGAETLAPAVPISAPAVAAGAPARGPDGAPAGGGWSLAGMVDLLREHRLAASLLAGGGAAALALLVWLRRRPGVAKPTAANPTRPAGGRRRRGPLRPVAPDRDRLMAGLKAACRAGDAATAHATLGGLSRLGAFNPPEPDLTAAGEALARHLYGADSRRWSGAALLAAVRRAERRQARAARRAAGARLAPLYPEA